MNFSDDSPLSGDQVTRDIFEGDKREHEVLRALHGKAREIIAMVEAKNTWLWDDRAQILDARYVSRGRCGSSSYG